MTTCDHFNRVQIVLLAGVSIKKVVYEIVFSVRSNKIRCLAERFQYTDDKHVIISNTFLTVHNLACPRATNTKYYIVLGPRVLAGENAPNCEIWHALLRIFVCLSY